jgi:hypothetical protein
LFSWNPQNESSLKHKQERYLEPAIEPCAEFYRYDFAVRACPSIVRGQCPRTIRDLQTHQISFLAAQFRIFRPGTLLALSQLRSPYSLSETFMTTQISTKFAAVLVALMMNALILAGVATVFDAASTRPNDASMADQQVVAAPAAHDVV